MMTFDEIAVELGVSHQRVHQIYNSAMRKLCRRPEVIRVLREFDQEMRQIDARRREGRIHGHAEREPFLENVPNVND